MIYEGSGCSVDGKENLRHDIEKTIAGWVYNNGKVYYSKDVSKDKKFKPHPKAKRKYYSLLCVPIQSNGKVYGVLSIDGSLKDCFNEDDINYFEIFANQIAIIFNIINLGKLLTGGVNYDEEVQITG